MDAGIARLILVKHAMPTIEPDVPAAKWRLSDEGRRACVDLAARLAEFEPTNVVGSTEPKAAETARIVAAELSLPCEIQEGLHEQDQSGTPLLGSQEWQVAVAKMFAAPDQLVFGCETAAAASDRFATAVADTLRHHPGAMPAIVAHGRVISLLVARTNPVDPFAFWRRLGLPSFVVLGPPDFRIVGVVESVSPPPGADGPG